MPIDGPIHSYRIESSLCGYTLLQFLNLGFLSVIYLSRCNVKYLIAAFIISDKILLSLTVSLSLTI